MIRKLIGRYFYQLRINPLFYVLLCAFVVFASIDFFYMQKFYVLGKAELHRFFDVFPYLSILFVPAMVSMCRFTGEEYVPVDGLILTIARNLILLMVCVCVMIFTMAVPLCVSLFGKVEWSCYFTGILGIFLYFFGAMPFGVYVFSRFRKSGPAFLFCAFILFAFNMIHQIPLYFEMGKLFQWILRGFSFAWHFDSFSKGIVSFSDTLFFILCGLYFCFLTVISLETGRGLSTGYFKSLKRIFVFSSLLLFVLMNVINARIDFSASKKFSLTKQTEIICRDVNEPLTITFYVSRELESLYPQVRDVSDLLEKYSLLSRNIYYVKENPARKGIEKILNDQGIYGQPLRTENSTTITSVYSAVGVEYLGQTKIIPFVIGTSTLEFDVTSRIFSLLNGESRFVQIAIASPMSLENDYSYIVPYLEANGFVVTQSYLPSQKSDENNLVTFDQLPKFPLLMLGYEFLTEEDCQVLEKFVLDGSRAFVASQPYTIDFANQWSVIEDDTSFFERTLFTFGIYFKHSITCDKSNLNIRMDSQEKDASRKSEYIDYPLIPVLENQENAPRGMTLYWPCAMDLDDDIAQMVGMRTKPLLLTSDSSWQLEKSNGRYETNPFELEKIRPDPERFTRSVVACASYMDNEFDGGIPSIIVMGDQYSLCSGLMTDRERQSVDSRALDFVCDSLLVLNGQEKFVSLKNKSYSENSAFYKLSANDMHRYEIISIVFTCIVPAVIILFVSIYFFKKRKAFNK